MSDATPEGTGADALDAAPDPSPHHPRFTGRTASTAVGGGMGPGLSLGLSTLVSAVVSVTAVATAFALRPATPPQAFAVIDLPEIYRLKESQITARLVQPDASRDERAAALQQAADFGAEVATLLKALPTECHCLVLTRAAVAGADAQHLPDLTALVRQRLRL